MTTFLIVTVALGVVGFILYAMFGMVKDAIFGGPKAIAKRPRKAGVPLPCEDIWNNPDLSPEDRDRQISYELEDYGVRAPFTMTPEERYKVLLHLERTTMRGRGFPCPQCKKALGDERHQCGECGTIFSQKPIRVTRSNGGLDIQFVG